MSDISDHLPSILLLKQTKMRNKMPIEFESRNLDDNKISQINEKLRTIDWNGHLNKDDCNSNFDTFCKMVNSIMDMIAPTKLRRISGRCRFNKPWLTTGLERSSRTLRKLYKSSLVRGSTDQDRDNYKKFRNMYNRTKRAMMVKYYRKKSAEYKSNTKKTVGPDEQNYWQNQE